MRAILNSDMIIGISFSDDATEIGPLPKGIGLERLRFDGDKVIDLADLSDIWVKIGSGGAFGLHCIDIGDCQLVAMAYSQRDLLINVSGLYAIKTPAEIEAERILALNQLAKARLVRKVKEQLGGIEEFQVHSLAFIAALIIYSRNQPPALAAFFDDIIPHIQDMFPMAQWETILKNSAQKLKAIITEYNANIE
jgi:hypothetical protein